MRTPKTFSLLSLLLLGGSTLLGGCLDLGPDSGSDGSATVVLSFQGLEPLYGGLNYQAWVVEEDNGNYRRLPLAIFNMDETGRIMYPGGGTALGEEFEANVNPGNIFGVQVSIEASSGLVPQSSRIFILGGEVSGGSADLTGDSWMGIGVNLEPMNGTYVLMSPTDEVDTNQLSGLWFAKGTEEDWDPGLFLPVAPEGWIYEGWAIKGTDTLSTGKFYDPDVPDPTNLYGGPGVGAPVPGQDFLSNPPEGISFPMDFSGGYAMVTLEPWDDYDLLRDSPFPLRLMGAEIPPGPTAKAVYNLTSLFSSFPRGTAVVRDR